LNFRIGKWTATIPTPFLLGQVFAKLPEMMVDAVYQKNPQSAKDWVANMTSAYVPDVQSFIPDILTPAVEVMMNRDFANRKIVPDYMKERRLPKDQYDDYTSTASRYFGWLLNQSPKQLDHLLRGYTGGIGYDIARIPDEGPLRAVGLSGVVRPEAYRSVNEFEEAWAKAQQAYGSAQAAKSMSPDVAREYHRLGAFNDAIDALRQMRNMAKTQDEKDAIGKRMVGVARKALNREPLPSYPTRKAG